MDAREGEMSLPNSLLFWLGTCRLFNDVITFDEFDVFLFLLLYRPERHKHEKDSRTTEPPRVGCSSHPKIRWSLETSPSYIPFRAPNENQGFEQRSRSLHMSHGNQFTPPNSLRQHITRQPPSTHVKCRTQQYTDTNQQTQEEQNTSNKGLNAPQ